jgi:hypothetical protein
MDLAQFAAIIMACLERGFQPPLSVCAVSVNGAVLAIRYAYTDDGGGMDATVLAEHYPNPHFLLQINLMITDTRGRAARVVFQHEGWNFAALN